MVKRKILRKKNIKDGKFLEFHLSSLKKLSFYNQIEISQYNFEKPLISPHPQWWVFSEFEFFCCFWDLAEFELNTFHALFTIIILKKSNSESTPINKNNLSSLSKKYLQNRILLVLQRFESAYFWAIHKVHTPTPLYALESFCHESPMHSH